MRCMARKIRTLIFRLGVAFSTAACLTLLAVWVRSYVSSGRGEGFTWIPVYRDAEPGFSFSADQLTVSVAWDRGGIEFLWMRWHLVSMSPPPPNWRPPVWQHTRDSIAEPLSYEFEASKDGLLRLGSRIWPLVLLSLVLPAAAVTRFVRRRRRLRNGWCEFCGYDLRASTDRCPECGAPVPDPATPRTTAGERAPPAAGDP